jgi:hypothetical protein
MRIYSSHPFYRPQLPGGITYQLAADQFLILTQASPGITSEENDTLLRRSPFDIPMLIRGPLLHK